MVYEGRTCRYQVSWAEGDQAGWLMTMVGVVLVVAFSILAKCCRRFFRFMKQKLIKSVPLADITLSIHLRDQYLAAVLVQDPASFDRIGSGEIVSRANRDVDSIRTGLGERLGYHIWSFAMITTVCCPFTNSSPSLID